MPARRCSATIRWLLLILLILLLPALLAALAWSFSPQLVPWLAARGVPPGWQLDLSVARPGLAGLMVRSVDLRHPDGWHVTAAGIHVDWQFGPAADTPLPWLDIDTITIDTLVADLRGYASAAADDGAGAALPDPAGIQAFLPRWWLPRLPFARLDVRSVNVLAPDSLALAPLAGTLHEIRDRELRVRLSGTRAGLPINATLHADVAGTVQLAIDGGPDGLSAAFELVDADADGATVHNAHVLHPAGWHARLQSADVRWPPARPHAPGSERGAPNVVVAALQLDLSAYAPATPADATQPILPAADTLLAFLPERWLPALPVAGLVLRQLTIVPAPTWGVGPLAGSLTVSPQAAEAELAGRWHGARLTAQLQAGADGTLQVTLRDGPLPVASAVARSGNGAGVGVAGDVDLGWWSSRLQVPVAGQLHVNARLTAGDDAVTFELLPPTRLQADWLAGVGGPARLGIASSPSLRARFDAGRGSWRLTLQDPLDATLRAESIGELDVRASAVTLDPAAAGADLQVHGRVPPPGLRQFALTATAQLDLVAETLRLVAGARLELQPAADLAVRVGPVVVTVPNQLTVSLQQPALPRTLIQLRAPSVQIPDLAPTQLGPLAFDGTLAADVDSGVRGTGALRVGGLTADTVFGAAPDGSWRAQFDTPAAAATNAPLPGLVRHFQPDLRVQAGSLAARGTLTGQLGAGAPTPALEANVDIADVTFTWAEHAGTARRVTSAASGPLDALVIGPTLVTEATLAAAGTPLRDAHVSIGPLPPGRMLADIDGSVGTLGGRVTFTCPQFDLEQTTGSCSIELDGLELQQVVALEQQARIIARGAVAGSLTLEFDRGQPRAHGALQTRGGGHLRYVSDPAVLRNADSAGLGLALRALEDFSYTELGARLALDPAGNLKLDATLQGRNPAVEGGRQIRFNLNIDTEGFWQALQITRGITDKLERRLRAKP